MKRKMAYIFAIVILVIISTVAYFIIVVPDYEPVIHQYTFNSSTGHKVYIIEKLWGISADHRQVVITETDPNSEAVLDTSYSYNGQLPFLYKQDNDTLYIYIQKALEEQKKLSGNIELKQVVLNNPEMMELLKDYEQKGLEKL